MNFRLWLSLLAMLMLPSLYTTLRVFFLNTAPDTSSVSIASQSVWLGLVYEVLSEALLMPLYFIFGRVVQQRMVLQQRVSVAVVASLLLYGVTTLVIWLFAEPLIQSLQQTEVQSQVATRFIRLEALSLMAGAFSDIVLVVLTTLAMHRWIVMLLIARTVLTAVGDMSLVSQFPWSLQLGVIGVGVSNLAVNTLLLVFTWGMLRRLGLLAWRMPADTGYIWLAQWLKVASYCGLEAALRNVVYAWVILRLINATGAASLYWNANQILWAWLLLPILALGQLVRRDAANSQGRIAERYRTYGFVLLVCLAGWLALWPTLDWFIVHVLGVADPAPLRELLSWLLPFYAVFSVTFLLQNYLYGMGRTDLIFHQSIGVNVFYYGSAMWLVASGYVSAELPDIVHIFGIGMCLSLFITLGQMWRATYFRRMSESSKKCAEN